MAPRTNAYDAVLAAPSSAERSGGGISSGGGGSEQPPLVPREGRNGSTHGRRVPSTTFLPSSAHAGSADRAPRSRSVLDHWSPAKGPAWLGGRWRWRWTTRARWQRLLRVLDTGPALRGASCSSSCWSGWCSGASSRGTTRRSRSPCYSSPFPFSLACAAAPATAAARACARP